MKKGFIIAILLALAAHAQVNVPYDSVYPPANTSQGIQRYSDFPLDNIHILRLQEASHTLGGNVSSLQGEQRVFQERQQQELSQMRSEIQNFERSMLAQLHQLQRAVEDEPVPPTIEIPAPVNNGYSPGLVALLGVNIFLLIVVIILIFWLREQYPTHKEQKE